MTLSSTGGWCKLTMLPADDKRVRTVPYHGLTLLMLATGQDHPVRDTARASAHPQGPTRKLKADENDIFNGTRMITSA